MRGGECVHASGSFFYGRGWRRGGRKGVDEKFSFFITGAAGALELPSDGLCEKNFELSDDGLSETEGVLENSWGDGFE
jgi:hypothetical protein